MVQHTISQRDGLAAVEVFPEQEAAAIGKREDRAACRGFRCAKLQITSHRGIPVTDLPFGQRKVPLNVSVHLSLASTRLMSLEPLLQQPGRLFRGAVIMQHMR